MPVTWGIFETDEEAFDLRHLDEMITFVEIGGEQHAILVEFSDHCFTEEAVPNDTRPQFTPSSRTNGRFCAKRYQASLDISEHIERAMRGSVWLGESDRCLIVKLMPDEGEETKRTKAWSDGWLAKLRDDQRRSGADVALIISHTLPKHIEQFDLVDGVWVAHPRCALPVAVALRQGLIDVSSSRLVQ